MTINNHEKQPVRIGGCSGGFTDRIRAISDLAQDPEVDAIMGDWLSEMTMTFHGVGKLKAQKDAMGKAQTIEEMTRSAKFAETLMPSFKRALPHLAKNHTKLAVNAGASDTELLAKICQDLVQKNGYELKVAWVEGDDVTEAVFDMIKAGEHFQSLTNGKNLESWGLEPVCAQAYLGGLGIAEALRQGADIVICGRVADAAPVVGIAAWWHGWSPDQFDELAGALMVGHLLECSNLVTGGYYSGFKDLLSKRNHLNLGYPIAEVNSKGEAMIYKEKNTGGCVTVGTVVSQLLYEIQGPLYYNSDVTADITNVLIEQVSEDVVSISGVKGLPPPPTTKVGITAPAGWQAEFHLFLVGLDVKEKARWTEEQVRDAIGDDIHRFSLLKFHVNGTSPIDAENQDVATVDFRIFAQSSDPEVMRTDNPEGLNRWILGTLLQCAPGVSISNDLRQIEPKPYYEYWVALLPQSSIQHRVHCLFDNNKIVNMEPPSITEPFTRQQPSYETENPVSLESFGETTRAPLGSIVLGRSGDKSSNCNIGFFVRHDDEWDWLRSLLTVDRIKEMLGPQEYRG